MDSVFSIRYFRDINRSEGLEIWKTKTDKNPKRILKNLVKEYSLNEDTIKVPHNYQPFEDKELTFENVDAC